MKEMKTKITFFILLIIASLSAFSQENLISQNLVGKFNNYKMQDGEDILKKAIAINSYNHSLIVKSVKLNTYQRLDSLIYYFYTFGNYTNVEAETYKYDNYKVIEKILKSWYSVSEAWGINNKTEYNYNSSDELVEEIEYEWIGGSNPYKNTYKYDYVYSNGNIIESYTYAWNSSSSQWLYSRKTEYSYNSSNEIINTNTYLYNNSTNQWGISFKEDYSYSNGNLTSIIRSNFYNNQWVNNMKKEYNYDSSGNQIESIDYLWDTTTSQWTNTSNLYKFSKTYLANNDIDNIIISKWNETNSTWSNLYKNDFTYDVNYSNNELIIPISLYDDFYNFNHKLNYVERFDFTINSTWLKMTQTDFFYSSQIVSVSDEPKVLSIKIFPNPTTNYLEIYFPYQNEQTIVEIFDQTGRTIISTILKEDKKIDVKILNPGIYFYNIINSDGKYSGKFIKN